MRMMLLLLVFAAGAPLSRAQEEPVRLRLAYKKGDRQSIRSWMKMKLSATGKAPSVQSSMKMDATIKFILKKECIKAEKDLYVFAAAFREPDMDQWVESNGQRVRVLLKGKHVRMETEGGDVLVDTEEGINPEAAVELMKEMQLFEEELDIPMDRLGVMKISEANEKVRRFFKGVGGDSLYPFMLPEQPVRVGDTWTYANRMQELGQLKLAGDGVSVPVKYRLVRFEGTGKRRAAILSTTMDSELKDLESKAVLSGMNREVTVKIRRLAVNGKGQTRFFPAHGRFSTSALDARVEAKMSIEIEELGGTMDFDVTADVSVQMVDPTLREKKREY